MALSAQSASKFFPPGNMAAGLASGLHVLLYVIGLAMILSTKYLGTKVRISSSTASECVSGSLHVMIQCLQECLELGLISTITVQLFYTIFGSYKHFAIANADTLPAAVMVSLRWRERVCRVIYGRMPFAFLRHACCAGCGDQLRHKLYRDGLQVCGAFDTLPVERTYTVTDHMRTGDHSMRLRN